MLNFTVREAQAPAESLLGLVGVVAPEATSAAAQLAGQVVYVTKNPQPYASRPGRSIEVTGTAASGPFAGRLINVAVDVEHVTFIGSHVWTCPRLNCAHEHAAIVHRTGRVICWVTTHPDGTKSCGHMGVALALAAATTHTAARPSCDC